jgi:hypothetical protein
MTGNQSEPGSIVGPPSDRISLVLPIDPWMKQNYFRLQGGWLSLGLILLVTLYFFHPASPAGIRPDAIAAEAFSPTRYLAEIMMRAGALEFFWLFVFQVFYVRSASAAADLLLALSFGFLLWIGLNIGLIDYLGQILHALTSFFLGSNSPQSLDVVDAIGRPAMSFNAWGGGSGSYIGVPDPDLTKALRLGQHPPQSMDLRKILFFGYFFLGILCLASPFPFLCTVFAFVDDPREDLYPFWLYLGLAVAAVAFSFILEPKTPGEIPAMAGAPLALGVCLVAAAAVGYGWWLDRRREQT